MHKQTGPGRVIEDPRYRGPGMLKAVLHNYDIDGDALKQEHTSFLTLKVVALLMNDGGRIWMQGSASRTGSNAHNMALSRRRVQNVAEVLKARGIAGSQMQLDAVGEEMAVGSVREDEKDRAVALLVLPKVKTDHKPKPEPPKVNKRFKIRMHAGLSASVVVGGEFLIFQIWDQDNGICSFFTYFGGVVAGGAIPGTWLSGTLKGPWNDFTTKHPIQVNHFGGGARFTSGGGGPWTANYLNFMGLPSGNMTLPNPLKMQTGFTIGLGAGTSTGVMSLRYVGEPEGILPFAGP